MHMSETSNLASNQESENRKSQQTSSMKITLGAILLASEKTALTYFSPSPNHWYRK